MQLSLPTICAIKTSLAMARLAHPNDPRFVLAYQELIRQWAADVDSEVAMLIEASRVPALTRLQV